MISLVVPINMEYMSQSHFNWTNKACFQFYELLKTLFKWITKRTQFLKCFWSKKLFKPMLKDKLSKQLKRPATHKK